MKINVRLIAVVLALLASTPVFAQVGRTDADTPRRGEASGFDERKVVKPSPMSREQQAEIRSLVLTAETSSPTVPQGVALVQSGEILYLRVLKPGNIYFCVEQDGVDQDACSFFENAEAGMYLPIAGESPYNLRSPDYTVKGMHGTAYFSMKSLVQPRNADYTVPGVVQFCLILGKDVVCGYVKGAVPAAFIIDGKPVNPKTFRYNPENGTLRFSTSEILDIQEYAGARVAFTTATLQEGAPRYSTGVIYFIN